MNKIIACSILSLLWCFDSNAMQFRAIKQQQEAAKKAEIQRIMDQSNSALGELQRAEDLDTFLKVQGVNFQPAVVQTITAAKNAKALEGSERDNIAGLLAVSNIDEILPYRAKAEMLANLTNAADTTQTETLQSQLSTMHEKLDAIESANNVDTIISQLEDGEGKNMLITLRDSIISINEMLRNMVSKM